MTHHPHCQVAPYAALRQDKRWFPAAEELRTTAASLVEGDPAHGFVHVDQECFGEYAPRDVAGLVAAFRECQAVA